MLPVWGFHLNSEYQLIYSSLVKQSSQWTYPVSQKSLLRNQKACVHYSSVLKFLCKKWLYQQAKRLIIPIPKISPWESSYSLFEKLPFLFPYQTCSQSGPYCASSSDTGGPPAQTHSYCQSLWGGLGSEGDKYIQMLATALPGNSLRDWLLFSLTLGPFSLHKVCRRVFRVLIGNSLLHCFSFSLGKTFIKMWMSRRILSRLMLLMVSGNSRTILHRHYKNKK